MDLLVVGMSLVLLLWRVDLFLMSAGICIVLSMMSRQVVGFRGPRFLGLELDEWILLVDFQWVLFWYMSWWLIEGDGYRIVRHSRGRVPSERGMDLVGLFDEESNRAIWFAKWNDTGGEFCRHATAHGCRQFLELEDRGEVLAAGTEEVLVSGGRIGAGVRDMRTGIPWRAVPTGFDWARLMHRSYPRPAKFTADFCARKPHTKYGLRLATGVRIVASPPIVSLTPQPLEEMGPATFRSLSAKKRRGYG